MPITRPALAVSALLLLTACQQETAGVETTQQMQQTVMPSVADLVGLDQPQIEALLGVPELIRREPPAAVLQYRTDNCVVDLFLYQEADRLRVTESTTRGRDGGTRQPDQCLAALVNRHANQVAELPESGRVRR